MSTEMNAGELGAFYGNLSALAVGGKEIEAREYLRHHLSRLPVELKNEILGLMFFEAIVDEANEIEAVSKIQEEGILAIKALEAVKREIEKEGKASHS